MIFVRFDIFIFRNYYYSYYDYWVLDLFYDEKQSTVFAKSKMRIYFKNTIAVLDVFIEDKIIYSFFESVNRRPLLNNID